MSENHENARWGYIGLGNMGAPMAKRLLDWPGGLTVYDIRAEAMTPLAEGGASLADSVADVAAADIISVTVLNDAQVREVVGELAAHAKPGTVIAIHSTISDTTAVELAENWSRRASTSSTRRSAAARRAAAKGELATMVGATDEVFAADQGAVFAVGVAGGPRRRAGRGNPDEAGPQHADVHLLRRRVRGHEAGRGRRAESAGRWARWCATPTPSPVAPGRSCSATT